MFISLFANPTHLLMLAGVLILVIIPAVIAFRVWAG